MLVAVSPEWRRAFQGTRRWQRGLRTQPDVYGMAITMAAKIQAVGTPGEVWIGERLHGHLHVNNQVTCVPVEPPASWRFVNGGNWAYKLYAIPVRSWVWKPEAA